MQLIQLRLCHVLLITTLLYIPERITANCDDWHLKGSNEVCCIRCSPGNRLVNKCGLDRTKLCTPCEPDTYTNEEKAPFCKRCTQCIEPQIQLKPCSASADTVCGCQSGYRCGNEQCTYCVMECKKGEEPTKQWTCDICPEGHFNNEIHSPCKPWRKSCPDGEYKIAEGNEFSDIKCSKIPETTPSATKETTTLKTTERPKADDNTSYLLLACFGSSTALTIILILSLWLTYKRAKNKSKSKDTMPDTPTQGELTIMMVDHEEACSFHQPEQEQGGSSESINTQDSETKLIV